MKRNKLKRKHCNGVLIAPGGDYGPYIEIRFSRDSSDDAIDAIREAVKVRGSWQWQREPIRRTEASPMSNNAGAKDTAVVPCDPELVEMLAEAEGTPEFAAELAGTAQQKFVRTTPVEYLRFERGETCQSCGCFVQDCIGSYWMARNRTWNEVVGGDPDAEASGILCPCCFWVKAEARGIHVCFRAETYARDDDPEFDVISDRIGWLSDLQELREYHKAQPVVPAEDVDALLAHVNRNRTGEHWHPGQPVNHERGASALANRLAAKSIAIQLITFAGAAWLVWWLLYGGQR